MANVARFGVRPERERLVLLGLAMGLTLIAGSSVARACVKDAAGFLSTAESAAERRLLDQLGDLFDRLDRRQLTAPAFVAEVQRHLADIDLAAAVGRRAHGVLPRRPIFLKGNEDRLPARVVKLRAMAPGQISPPHAHHDEVSIQYVISGRLSVRQYDKVRRTGDATLLLRPTRRWVAGPGDMIGTAERYRNVHWLANDGDVTVLLNVKAMGDVGWTLDRPEIRRPGRLYLDPDSELREDGLLMARQIDERTAMARFGSRHPQAFPWPGKG